MQILQNATSGHHSFTLDGRAIPSDAQAESHYAVSEKWHNAKAEKPSTWMSEKGLDSLSRR